MTTIDAFVETAVDAAIFAEDLTDDDPMLQFNLGLIRGLCITLSAMAGETVAAWEQRITDRARAAIAAPT